MGSRTGELMKKDRIAPGQHGPGRPIINSSDNNGHKEAGSSLLTVLAITVRKGAGSPLLTVLTITVIRRPGTH